MDQHILECLQGVRINTTTLVFFLLTFLHFLCVFSVSCWHRTLAVNRTHHQHSFTMYDTLCRLFRAILSTGLQTTQQYNTCDSETKSYRNHEDRKICEVKDRFFFSLRGSDIVDKPNAESTYSSKLCHKTATSLSKPVDSSS